VRVLWVGGSDLAVVLVVSFVGSDLAGIVFQKACCYCGWVDLIWLLFLLFCWVILLCCCCFSDDVLLLLLVRSDLAVVLVISLGDYNLAVVVFQMTYCCCGWMVLT
jgi:hypothetical protein